MNDRILELVDKKREELGISEAAMCKMLGIGNGIIGKWRNGRQRPGTDAIIKVSELCHVSTDYILKGVESTTDKFDEEILSTIHQLPAEARRDFLGALRLYASVHSSSSEE